MFKIIPEKILYDKELPDKAKFLMAEILSFSVNSLECFTNNDTWAERYGISKSNISRYISVLVEKGYVIRKIIYKANTKRILKRILIASPKVMYDLEDMSIGAIERLEKEDEDTIQKRKAIIEDLKKIWE